MYTKRDVSAVVYVSQEGPREPNAKSSTRLWINLDRPVVWLLKDCLSPYNPWFQYKGNNTSEAETQQALWLHSKDGKDLQPGSPCKVISGMETEKDG